MLRDCAVWVCVCVCIYPLQVVNDDLGSHQPVSRDDVSVHVSG